MIKIKANFVNVWPAMKNQHTSHQKIADDCRKLCVWRGGGGVAAAAVVHQQIVWHNRENGRDTTIYFLDNT